MFLISSSAPLASERASNLSWRTQWSMLPLSDPAEAQEAQTGPTMVLVKPAIGMVPLGRDKDIENDKR